MGLTIADLLAAKAARKNRMTKWHLKAQPLFLLGMVVTTPGFLDWAEANNVSARQYLKLHVTGDYGTMDAEDVQANKDAIKYGSRIMSAYVVDGTKFWIITEADRSVTTLLLPEEY